ncbi:Uma2 family endonuclease, partial [Desulfococcaceae bacterium HSG8]|nr:Uma2 family endonuclease [Desulfococcaceae bacterium HSG8]
NVSAKTISHEPEEAIFYPDTDGKPMAESDFQRNPLVYCVEALKEQFSTDPDVYVSGNLLIYYEQGNPLKSVAPDVFVVFGVPGYDRSSYKIWEEGKFPDAVIKIISKSTWKKDPDNVSLYRRLGVKEYFLFDPTGRYIDPALRGYRLDKRGTYRQIRVVNLPGGILKSGSLRLGLELRVESGRLRLYDPKRGEYLFNLGEEKQGRLQAEARAERAEEEIRRLREKLKALED